MARSSKKRIAFLPAHPAQVWLLNSLYVRLQDKYDVIWFIRDKDISCELASQLNIEYIVLSKASRGIIGNAFELAMNVFKCIYYTKKYHIDLWVTKYGCGNIAAKICGKKSISYNDDDVDIVPMIAKTSYSFSDLVIVPQHTRMGAYEHLARRYEGSHELCYLHPDAFQPDETIYNALKFDTKTRYCIVRLSALSSHHDSGIDGISRSLLKAIILKAEKKNFKVLITSETGVPFEYQDRVYRIASNKIHHALFYSSCLITDSQTMALEASTLDTPVFQISSFKGRLSAVEEQVKRGRLNSYLPCEEAQFLKDFEQFLNTDFKCKKLLAEEKSPNPIGIFVEKINEML